MPTSPMVMFVSVVAQAIATFMPVSPIKPIVAMIVWFEAACPM